MPFETTKREQLGIEIKSSKMKSIKTWKKILDNLSHVRYRELKQGNQ